MRQEQMTILHVRRKLQVRRFLSTVTWQTTQINSHKSLGTLSLNNMYTLHKARTSLANEQRGTWWMLVDWMSMRMRMCRRLRMLLLGKVMMVRIYCQVTR